MKKLIAFVLLLFLAACDTNLDFIFNTKKERTGPGHTWQYTDYKDTNNNANRNIQPSILDKIDTKKDVQDFLELLKNNPKQVTNLYKNWILLSDDPEDYNYVRSNHVTNNPLGVYIYYISY